MTISPDESIGINRVGTWAGFSRLYRSGRKKATVQVEEWVHAEVIEQLLRAGVPGETIRHEFWLDPHSRCDVVVERPGRVTLYEVKCEARHANSTARRQVRRYIAAAALMFPDAEIDGWLVWPEPDGLACERVA